MTDYETLTKAGIDMDGLLKRLMGNASLVRVFIKKFTEDTTFETLQAAFSEQNMAQAEMASHTLKGMCGNLSLTVLYELFTAQVNLIRGSEYQKAAAMMSEITPAYSNALEKMREWLSET